VMHPTARMMGRPVSPVDTPAGPGQSRAVPLVLVLRKRAR
jgi:hypothetical protein